jgi:hypothetical protein
MPSAGHCRHSERLARPGELSRSNSRRPQRLQSAGRRYLQHVAALFEVVSQPPIRLSRARARRWNFSGAAARFAVRGPAHRPPGHMPAPPGTAPSTKQKFISGDGTSLLFVNDGKVHRRANSDSIYMYHQTFHDLLRRVRAAWSWRPRWLGRSVWRGGDFGRCPAAWRGAWSASLRWPTGRLLPARDVPGGRPCRVPPPRRWVKSLSRRLTLAGCWCDAFLRVAIWRTR